MILEKNVFNWGLKMNKNIALLYMIELLDKQGKMEKKVVTERLKITDVSFYRYLKAIRNYFKFLDDGREVCYDRNTDSYLLVCKSFSY
jgi:hypothetical protein